MNQEFQIDNCPYCNNNMILSKIITKFTCYNCDVKFYHNRSDKMLYQVIIHYRPTYCIAIIPRSNVTYFYHMDGIQKNYYKLPKSLSLDYILSHSKEEIFTKVNSLLAFI